MDKVNSSNSQAMPLWERQKNTRGHHTAVDKALDAHRTRTSEREARVQERINIVRGMHSQFFPQPQMAMQPNIVEDEIDLTPEASNPFLTTSAFNQRNMNNLFEEAELGTSQDKVINLLAKERSNPEEGPIDDMPKGSIVDYTI